MANKGYASILQVSQYLAQVASGVTTLTADQQTQTTTLIGFAEQYIDTHTHRSWLTPPITNEQYTILVPTIRLKQSPITSVQQIQTRTTAIGDTWYTLTAGTDYEVFDTSRGIINFSDGYANHSGRMIAQISYTPNQPVPADITQAATAIVAASLYPALNPDRNGLAQVQADNQTKVVYDSGRFTLLVPDDAQRIIDHYALPIISH